MGKVTKTNRYNEYMGTEINHVVGVWCVNNFGMEEYPLFSLIPSLHVKYTDIGFIVLKTNIRVFFLRILVLMEDAL